MRAWAATYYPGWSVNRITLTFDGMGKAVLPVPPPPYLPREKPKQPDLSVIIVRPTASEERGRYGADTEMKRRAERVAKLGTLAELEPAEITDAVWFGASAMAQRLPVLRATTIS